MNGNNSRTEAEFLSALANPRKVELANILLSEDENKIDTAIAAGFNIVIVQEMARDIRNGIVDRESFTVQGNGAMKKAAEVESPVESPVETPVESPVVDEATIQNEPTNENTIENEVENEVEADPVSSQSVPQGESNQADPEPNTQA